MSTTRSYLWWLALFACAGLTLNNLFAGEAPPVKRPPAAEEEPDYKNWIEFGIGGLIIHGDGAQFKQQHWMSGDVFGGISDLHYEHAVAKRAV